LREGRGQKRVAASPNASEDLYKGLVSAEQSRGSH